MTPRNGAPVELPEPKLEIEGEDLPLSFDSPESSIIERADYIMGSGQLTVHMKRDEKTKSTRTYTYTGIPVNKWMEFVQAASKGAYFNKHIRPLFAGTAFVEKDR